MAVSGATNCTPEDSGVFVKLPQRSNPIQNPQGPALGCDHQVVFMYQQVIDTRGWQIQLQALPMLTVIKGDKHTTAGAGV